MSDFDEIIGLFIVGIVLFLGIIILWCVAWFSGFMASFLGLSGIYWWIGGTVLFFMICSILTIPLLVTVGE